MFCLLKVCCGNKLPATSFIKKVTSLRYQGWKLEQKRQIHVPRFHQKNRQTNCLINSFLDEKWEANTPNLVYDVTKTSKRKEAEAKPKEEPEKKMRKKADTTEKASKQAKVDEEAPPKKTTRAGAAKKEKITKEEILDENETAVVKKKVTRSKKTKDEDLPVEKVLDSKKATKSQKLKGKQEKKNTEESQQTEEEEGAKKGKKRRGAVKVEKNESKDEPPTKLTKANATVTTWETIDFKCVSKNSKGETSNFHITSWNVDGLRAWVKKGGLNILEYDKPDIFCMQETKCSAEKLPEEVKTLEDYEVFWCSSDKEGYAGVGIATKIKPISVKYGIDSEEHDTEGRCITAEYETFFLVNVYVPNAGRKLVTLPKRLDWNTSFKAHIKKLDELKPVIVCGDMNVSHLEIDLANPKSNTKNAGFTEEERNGMTEFLQDGYIDTFRKLYPDKEKAYTFWTYLSNARSKNVGWRLDYFIVSERLMEHVCDNIIHSRVLGSDHCPLTLHINI
ncbi:DNA-(apurinic or apyrimidinic site) endonuclease isoform X2 [Zophobas morio]|uniref:DNA-(apurinic or apyrimidinic site) endonuclease isoform X2 n=1 Tax=Zophobas morio TaxID=2755281 RepID=UPI003083BCAB